MAKSAKTIKEPVKFNVPVVVVPVSEYELLLKEAGYMETPELDRNISKARERFNKGKFTKWETLKNDLL